MPRASVFSMTSLAIPWGQTGGRPLTFEDSKDTTLQLVYRVYTVQPREGAVIVSVDTQGSEQQLGGGEFNRPNPYRVYSSQAASTT